MLPWFNNHHLPTGRSTSCRHAPSSLCSCLSISLSPPPLLFMPEPRRRRQRAAALLRPADIPGLAHLQRAVVVTRIGEGFGCLFPSHSAQCPGFRSRRERQCPGSGVPTARGKMAVPKDLAQWPMTDFLKTAFSSRSPILFFLFFWGGLRMVPDMCYGRIRKLFAV